MNKPFILEPEEVQQEQTNDKAKIEDCVNWLFQVLAEAQFKAYDEGRLSEKEWLEALERERVWVELTKLLMKSI